ncbi:tRNA pseudouridine(38-40) synthase TruA [Hyphococcus sp.]|uniref:tRNA pseudouridine(38-40) synthase TruA n=1 Tax=Hyphococcus sp. TaxID=2038636 RepID=UPI003CCC278F
MQRYKLIIEYAGTNYVGWQRQANGPSIQEAIEDAFQKFCGETLNVYAAGRTDAGVHALAMTAHVDLAKDYSPDTVCGAVNYHLKPHPIAVLACGRAEDNFHARFSCLRRAYEYRIVNRRAPLALDAKRAWRVAQKLDAAAMDAAAQHLVGKHDFTTFRAAACQAESPVKSLEEISVSRAGEEVIIRCAARSFLHHQVRSITGSLVEVGKGRWRPRDMKTALEAADRTRCGPVAPPDGLYFVRAEY